MFHPSEREAVHHFQELAARYCALLEEARSGADEPFLRELVGLLASLYAAALALPEVALKEEQGSSSVDTDAPIPRPDLKHPPLVAGTWYQAATLDLEARPTVGDLNDDLLDIHADLRDGLAHWARGTEASRAEAVFEWRLSFHSHWGTHAVNALAVLHPLWLQARG